MLNNKMISKMAIFKELMINYSLKKIKKYF